MTLEEVDHVLDVANCDAEAAQLVAILNMRSSPPAYGGREESEIGIDLSGAQSTAGPSVLCGLLGHQHSKGTTRSRRSGQKSVLSGGSQVEKYQFCTKLSFTKSFHKLSFTKSFRMKPNCPPCLVLCGWSELSIDSACLCKLNFLQQRDLF